MSSEKWVGLVEWIRALLESAPLSAGLLWTLSLKVQQVEDGFLVVEEVVAVEGDYPSSQGHVAPVEEDCPSQGNVVAVEDYLGTSLVVAKEDVCTCTQISTRCLIVCPVSSP